MGEGDSIEIKIGRWFQASARGVGVFALPLALAATAVVLWLAVHH